jgi:hypothetical protein
VYLLTQLFGQSVAFTSQFRVDVRIGRRPSAAVAEDDRKALMTAQDIVGAESGDHDNDDDQGIAVDVRVRVHPGTDDEGGGLVVDDFGDSAGYSVDIGDSHIADPARRWAVLLDTGSLTFVNSDVLTPE